MPRFFFLASNSAHDMENANQTAAQMRAMEIAYGNGVDIQPA
jgi:hypothetical protein